MEREHATGNKFGDRLMTKRKIALGAAVEVIWDDIQIHTNSQEDLSKCGFARAKTRGYLIYDEGDVVKIAGTIYDDANTPSEVYVFKRANIVDIILC